MPPQDTFRTVFSPLPIVMAVKPHISEPSSLSTLPLAYTRSSSATDMRPWGSFTILDEGPGYKIKRIEVNPGHRLSLQMHYHRSEHWIVVSGTARVFCDGQEIVLCSNQSTYVPQAKVHRLENPGVIPLVVIEVQNGDYLGEDDIIRFQDDYFREKP
jgi:mannose-6-phosphate isomerase